MINSRPVAIQLELIPGIHVYTGSAVALVCVDDRQRCDNTDSVVFPNFSRPGLVPCRRSPNAEDRGVEGQDKPGGIGRGPIRSPEVDISGNEISGRDKSERFATRSGRHLWLPPALGSVPRQDVSIGGSHIEDIQTLEPVSVLASGFDNVGCPVVNLGAGQLTDEHPERAPNTDVISHVAGDEADFEVYFSAEHPDTDAVADSRTLFADVSDVPHHVTPTPSYPGDTGLASGTAPDDLDTPDVQVDMALSAGPVPDAVTVFDFDEVALKEQRAGTDILDTDARPNQLDTADLHFGCPCPTELQDGDVIGDRLAGEGDLRIVLDNDRPDQFSIGGIDVHPARNCDVFNVGPGIDTDDCETVIGRRGLGIGSGYGGSERQLRVSPRPAVLGIITMLVDKEALIGQLTPARNGVLELLAHKERSK